MAEKSESIPRVQRSKIRVLNPDEKKALKSTLFNATVSDMRTLIIWSIEEPYRFDHFVERVLDGVSYKLSMREAEYL
jgi:hypothetical protein